MGVPIAVCRPPSAVVRVIPLGKQKVGAQKFEGAAETRQETEIGGRRQAGGGEGGYRKGG